ncbi:MAG: methylenetetrahydrofolate reductase, partial [Aquiluna sp.]
ISFEVYPPRRPEDQGRLEEAIVELEKLEPKFISVTFGAGGSSTKGSLDVLRFIRENTTSTPLAHLTCVGTTRAEAEAIVREFQSQEITDFLALRGDLPTGSGQIPGGAFERADQLVELLSAMRTPGSNIAVAAFPNGHPESGGSRQDLDALFSKQEKGADFAITQLFFFADDYLSFLELAASRGIKIPIIPGIMPIVSLRRLNRVLELSGEERPMELSEALEAAADVDAQREVGIEWAANQVRDLVAAGVDSLHLYAFNEYANVTEVLRRAGVRN